MNQSKHSESYFEKQQFESRYVAKGNYAVIKLPEELIKLRREHDLGKSAEASNRFTSWYKFNELREEWETKVWKDAEKDMKAFGSKSNISKQDDMVRRFFRKARDYKRAYRERDEKTAGAARELVKRYKSHRACPPSEAQRQTYKPWGKKRALKISTHEADPALSVKAAEPTFLKSYHDLFKIGTPPKKKPVTTDPSAFKNWVFYDGDNHTFGIIRDIEVVHSKSLIHYNKIKKRTCTLVSQVGLDEFQNLLRVGVIKWIGEGKKGKQFAREEQKRIEAEIEAGIFRVK